MAYAINTQHTVNKLNAGKAFNKKQAELIVDTIVDATAHLATKNDLKHLEQKVDLKLQANKNDIIAKMYIGMVSLGGVLIAAMAII